MRSVPTCGRRFWLATERMRGSLPPAGKRSAGSSTSRAIAPPASQSAGIGRVEVIGADTVADTARFFSHRRRTLAGGGPIGHQISIIALPG